MHSIDLVVQNYLSSARTPAITSLMYMVSKFFDLSFYSVAVVILVGLLVYMFRGRRYAFLFILSLTAGVILAYFAKSFFNVGRPIDEVMSVFGQSFPSYHATIATVFFGMLMYTFDTYFKRFWRVIFNSLCVFIILLVSFSRLYLGVHWLSDVLGGIILGICVCLMAAKIDHFSKFNRQHSN